MLKALGKKLGLGELEQFKKCIMKVPILAQCLTAEKARVTSRTVATSAASAATPLLSSEDEGQCSQEELYEGIKRLNSDGHVPTRELITCYRDLHDNPDKFSNLNVQIEDSPNKKFYKKICLLLDSLLAVLAVEEFKARQQLMEREVKELKAAEMKSFFEKRDAALAAGAQQQRELEDSLEESRRNLVKNSENPTDTLALLRKLADLFFKKYEYDRAFSLLEECLDISKRVLGEDHPETLKSLQTLADLYTTRNNIDRALPLYEELLAKQKRVLGEDDPETLHSLGYLAGAYSIDNNIDRALQLYEELLAMQERVLGEDHPDTLLTLQTLTYLYNKVKEPQQKEGVGEYDRALQLYEELLAKQKRVLGEDHPDMLILYRRNLDDARRKVKERQQKEGTGASLGGRSKNKRNHKNKSFRSTRRRRYSRARGGKKIAASSSKTIKRRRKNAR